jgi:hypothetical protein
MRLLNEMDSLMKPHLPFFIFVFAICASAADQPELVDSRERIRVVHQDISKWDKNGDGKLTGRERDEFLKDKRKERADAEAAERAAKANAKPPKIARVRPALSAEDAGKPTPKGVPKNIEDAAK